MNNTQAIDEILAAGMGGEMATLIEKADRWGFPEDFCRDGVAIEYNPNSRNIFFTNEDYQVCMMNDNGRLASWYYSPYEGIEGFADDILNQYHTMHPEDQEWAVDILGFVPDAESEMVAA